MELSLYEQGRTNKHFPKNEEEKQAIILAHPKAVIIGEDSDKLIKPIRGFLLRGFINNVIH